MFLIGKAFLTSGRRNDAYASANLNPNTSMKTTILTLFALLTTAMLVSCSAGGSANVSGSGIGSASLGGSGSISRDRR